MNGDGRAEVVVADNLGSAALHERARVVFGRPAGSPPLDLAQLGDGGFSLVDSRRPFQWIQVRGGGDVNGDGRGDLVATSYVRLAHHRYAGVAAVVFGAPSADPVSINRPGPRLLEAVGPSVPMIKPPPGIPASAGVQDMIGPTPVQAVTIVGDTDGDGLDDLLVGGFASPHGRLGAGSALLFRGRRTPGRIRLSGSATRGASGRVVRIDGAYAGDGFGGAAAPAGDFDGDRRPDLLVSGASSTRNGRLRSGAAWVLTDVGP
jgi:glycosylphosphatidylinositol phospholipase D